MTKPFPDRRTENQHFRYAHGSIHSLYFALEKNNYYQYVENYLSRIEQHTAEGWLLLREISYPQYGPPYERIEYFRNTGPAWLTDFHRKACAGWMFCEYELTGSGFTEEPEVLLSGEQFKEMLQIYLHNAIFLYQVMEKSAIDAAYLASSEELTLKKWCDPRRFA